MRNNLFSLLPFPLPPILPLALSLHNSLLLLLPPSLSIQNPDVAPRIMSSACEDSAKESSLQKPF